MKNSNGHTVKKVTIFASCDAEKSRLAEKLASVGFRHFKESGREFTLPSVEVDVVGMIRSWFVGFDILVTD